VKYFSILSLNALLFNKSKSNYVYFGEIKSKIKGNFSVPANTHSINCDLHNKMNLIKLRHHNLKLIFHNKLTQMHICNNCGSQFTDKYCSHCGMKKNDGRLYFRDQWHDAMFYVFSLDSPLWKTFKGLMINPGKVGREYIQGKRKAYYTPIKYFILCTAIYFLTIKISGFDPVEKVASEQIRKNLNYFLFLFVFILPVFLKLFFKKQGYNYSEYLSFSFFLIGQYILFNILFIPLIYLDSSFIFIRYILMLYLAYGIFTFHSGKFLPKLIKSLIVPLISFVIYAMLTMALVISYLKIFHGY
jgi:ribosomal protein L37E